MYNLAARTTRWRKLALSRVPFSLQRLTDGARAELLARAEQLATERTEAMRECGLWTADDVRAWLEEQ
jgi:hypothetical protein